MAVRATKITPKASAKASPATAAKAAKPKAAAETAAPVSKATTPATVTSKQLAARLAEAQGMPRQQAEAVLDGVVGLLVEHLKAGDRLRLSGFGVLEVKDRPARGGRNPATGEAIQIAASRKVAFRPAKELKDAI